MSYLWWVELGRTDGVRPGDEWEILPGTKPTVNEREVRELYERCKGQTTEDYNAKTSPEKYSLPGPPMIVRLCRVPVEIVEEQEPHNAARAKTIPAHHVVTARVDQSLSQSRGQAAARP